MALRSSFLLCALEMPTLDPEFAGLTKHGYRNFFSMVSDDFCGLLPIIDFQEPTIGRDRNVVAFTQLFRYYFIHADGRAENACPDVRNSCPIRTSPERFRLRRTSHEEPER